MLYFHTEHLNMLHTEFTVSLQEDRTDQKTTLHTPENLSDVFIFKDLRETYLIKQKLQVIFMSFPPKAM